MTFNFQDFNILEQIGKGTYGIVYKAKTLGGHTVAVKSTLVDNETLQLYTMRENEIMSKLSHPNIPKYFGQAQSPDAQMVHIIMEYIDGIELFQYTVHRRFSNAAITKIILETADALRYCHSKNVMHRDVKMENIMYSGGHIKLIDFGFARYFETPSTPVCYGICGTVEYHAYELVMCQPYDERIDIWALGIVYYELLTDRYPFAGDNDYETQEKIKSGELKMSRLSTNLYCKDIWDMITGMIQRDSANRISLDNLYNRLQTLLKKIEDPPRELERVVIL